MCHGVHIEAVTITGTMDHDFCLGLEIDCLVQADLFLEMRSKLQLVTGTLEEANPLTLGYGHRYEQ